MSLIHRRCTLTSHHPIDPLKIKANN